MLRTLMRAVLGSRLPQVDGTIAVEGVRAPVTIRRDAHGVPYIEATCDEDAFYGLGFCQGQDRGFQVEFYVRVARGTLAEIIGPEMLAVDQLSRRIGFSHIARAQLALVDPPVRAQFEAFARGVNDGARIGVKRPHELTLLGAERTKFEASDVLAGLQFLAFGLSSNWDAELARLRILHADGPDALAALEAAHPSWIARESTTDRLTTDVGVLAAAARLLGDATTATRLLGLGGASNNWVLAPSRTATGRPLLACDPHLTPALPAPWYLVHVRTPTWAMSGASLPCQPIVSFGHNEHVAWGATAGHVDNTDLFLEDVGPDGQSVRRGDAYEPCEVREELIRVKGQPDVHERVLVTRHGPILSPALGGNIALSMRATWMAARRVGTYDLFRARDVDDVRQRFSSYPAVSESRLFADVSGRIAWLLAGDVPVRRKGNGMLPMPGWDPEVGWEDEPLPFDQLPTVSDPAAGFLASANNCPAQAPGGPFLGADWLDGFRYQHIVESLAPKHDWDVAATMRLQVDRTSVLWRRLRVPLLTALRTHGSSKEGLRLLEPWDGVVSADSPAAAVFELLFAELMCRAAKAKAPHAFRAALGEGTNVVLPHGIMALRRIDHLARCLEEQPGGWFERGWPAEIGSALDAAVEQLQRVAGNRSDGWAWGRVRPLTLVHPVGTKPPLGRIFNIGPLPCGGDATTIPQASVTFDHPLENPIGIANMRMVLDVGNWDASRWALAGGQSGNPLSPHYRDLVDPWQRGEGISIAWSPESVQRAARSTLRLVPA